MRKILKAGLVLGALCAAGQGALAQERYSIGSGSIGGVYYLWGGALAQIWSEKVSGAQFNAEATTGPTQNLILLESGDLAAALLNSNTAAEGWDGAGWAEGRRFEKQRAAVALYPSELAMIAVTGSGIASFSDLDGKNVHLGPRSGTADVVVRRMFEILEVEPAKIINTGWSDATTGLQDGLVDAVAGIGGHPFPAIMDAQTSSSVDFFGLSRDEITVVTKAIRGASEASIPGETYSNLTENYNTIAFWNILQISADIPEETAYSMMSALFDNTDVLKATHPSTARFMTMDRVLQISEIPLHPGVIRFLKEQGYDVPMRLVPKEQSE